MPETSPDEKLAKRREVLGRVGRALAGIGLPILGTAVGGPVGGAVAAKVAKSLGLKEDADPYEIEEAVVAADPSLLIELRKMESDLAQAQLAAMSTEAEELTKRAATDVQSDSVLARNVRPASLAFLVVSFIVFVFASTFYLDPQTALTAVEFGEQIKQLLWTVIGFYFGTRGWEKVSRMRNGGES